MHKISDEFEFRSDRTTDYGVSCPWVSKLFLIDLKWENGVCMLAHSFLIKSSSKLLVTRTGIKAWMSLISGLWFPWPIYMFFEMRFDLGTLDSGERSLPFRLLVGCTLHLLPYFMCVNSEGSGKTVRMCRLTWTFVGHLCDKYHNLMSWLKWWLGLLEEKLVHPLWDSQNKIWG